MEVQAKTLRRFDYDFQNCGTFNLVCSIQHRYLRGGETRQQVCFGGG